MNKTLNFRYLIRIVAILGLITVAVWLVHRVQAGKVADAFLHQADAAEGRDDLGHAMNYLRRLLVLQPNNTDARARLAVLMQQVAQTNEDFNLVYLEMEQVLRDDQNRDDVRKREVTVAMRLGLYSEALKNIESLFKKPEFQDDATLYDLKGQCETVTEKNKDAKVSFERAIELDPKLVDTYGRFARLLRRQKDKDADNVIQEMLEKNSKSAPAHLVAAQYWKDAGDLNRFEAEIGEARKCDPTDPEVALTVAAIENSKANEQTEKGDDAEAKKILTNVCPLLDQAIKKNLPETEQKVTRDNREPIRRARNLVAIMYLQLGNFQLRSGQLNEATKTAVESVKRFGNELPDLRLQLVDVSIAAKNWKDAENQLLDLEKIRLSAWTIYLYRGRIEVGKGDLGKAVEQLEKAANETGVPRERMPEIQRLLGDSYSRMGILDRSYQAYHRAIPASSRGILWARASTREAAVLVELQRLAEAKAIYEHVVTRYSGASLPLARLLWLESLQSPADKDRLQTQIDSLLKQAPANIDRELFKARMFASQGKNDLNAARTALNDAIKSFPDAAEPWAELAFLEWQHNNPDQARSVLAKAEVKFPKRTVLFRLVRAQMIPTDNLDQLGKELDALAKGADQLEKDERQRLLRGLAQAAQTAGARDVADRFWDRLASEWSYYLPYHLIRFDNAIATNSRSRIEQTKKDIQAIDAANLGRMVEALFGIWKAQHTKDRPDLADAEEALRKLEQVRPGWSRISAAQAMIDDLQGKKELALSKYRQAIDLGERNPEIIRRAVELYYEQKQPIEAERMMRRLPQDTKFGEGFEQIAAELSLYGKNLTKALALAEKAAPADSKDYKKLLWRSRIMWMADNAAEAEKSLKSAINVSPGIADAWIMLVQLRANPKQNKKPDMALIEQTIKEAEQSVDPKERTLAMAQCYEIASSLDKEMLKQAERLYGQLDNKDHRSKDLQVLKSAANFHLRTGNLQEARDILDRILNLGNLSEDQKRFARQLLPILTAADRNYETSRKALEDFKLLDPQGLPKPLLGNETVEDLRTRAMTFGLQHDVKFKREAIRLFEELRVKQGLRDEDRFVLAQLNRQVGDWLKAQAALKPLLDEDKDPSPAYISLYAAILVHQKRLQEAEPWVAKLEKSQPNVMTTVGLRATLLAARDPVKARDYLLEKMKEPTITQLQIAQLLESLGSAPAAEPIYRRLANQPDSPNGRLTLALYLGRQNRIDEALETCGLVWKDGDPERVAQACVGVLYSAQTPTPEQINKVDNWIQDATRKNSASLSLKSSLAALRNLQKDYDATITLYRQVVAGNPRDMVALNNLAYLLSAHQGNHEEALKLISSAKRSFGPVPTFLDTEAQVCIAKGDYGQAISLLNEAVSSEPSASHYFHLAQAYFLSNSLLNARSAWAQAMKLDLKKSQLHELERKQFDQMSESLTSTK